MDERTDERTHAPTVCAGHEVPTALPCFPRHRGGVSLRVGAVGREQHHVGHSGESRFPYALQERPDLALVKNGEGLGL